jgi:hypothetical protein
MSAQRITWDWRHAFCHKACRLTNNGYEKASFTPVPAEPGTSANPRDVRRNNAIGGVLMINNEYLLKKTLDRIDLYIESTNNKAAYIIAFNTFVFGSLIFNFNNILGIYNYDIFKYITTFFLFLTLAGNILSFYYIFNAIFPFLDSGNDLEYKTMLFFGSISKMSLDNYNKKIKNMNQNNCVEDLIKQNYILSKSLSNKYKCIKKSSDFIIKLILLPTSVIIFLKLLDSILSIFGVKIC